MNVIILNITERTYRFGRSTDTLSRNEHMYYGTDKKYETHLVDEGYKKETVSFLQKVKQFFTINKTT